MVGDQVLCEGDWLSLNGSTGDVILGKIPLSPPALSADLEIFLSWVDEVKQVKVKSLHRYKFIVDHDWPLMILSTFKSSTKNKSIFHRNTCFKYGCSRLWSMQTLLRMH